MESEQTIDEQTGAVKSPGKSGSLFVWLLALGLTIVAVYQSYLLSEAKQWADTVYRAQYLWKPGVNSAHLDYMLKKRGFELTQSVASRNNKPMTAHRAEKNYIFASPTGHTAWVEYLVEGGKVVSVQTAFEKNSP